LNRIRREKPAFRHDRRLRFFPVDTEALIAYGKSTPDLSNVVIVVVNLDPHHAQSGFLELPLAELGIDQAHSYQVDDLLGGARYLWQGRRNYVTLDPGALGVEVLLGSGHCGPDAQLVGRPVDDVPAQVFRVRRRIRTEHDFDYFL
jgi:starch synthase (maltosyl-transferring)